MWDVHVAALAAQQHNRFSRAQVEALGMGDRTIRHRLHSGRWLTVEEAVFAVAPVLDDPWGRWMGATLTAPGTVLSHSSAAAAYGWLREGPLVTVTRPGDGGPRRFGGFVAYRSSTLAGETAERRGVPMTCPTRTLVDIAPRESTRAVARALRQAVVLGHTTLPEVGDALGRYSGRRGIRRLALAVSSYAGLPLERARSASEVRAMQVLRDAGVLLPRLNVKVAGVEADLSWAKQRLIIEIDGAPFHEDRGEDARKEAMWRAAGWRVERLPAEAVYAEPCRLIGLANVPDSAP